MRIEGTIPIEYRKEITEDRSYHILYESIEEGGKENYVYYHRYNHRFGGISGVRDLLRLVSTEKANKIDKIIKEIENQKVYLDEEQEIYIELITISQIKELLRLTEGLDKAFSSLLDKNGYIYPSKLKFLKEKYPLLITSRKDEDGKTTYSLEEALWAANNTIWFLNLAQKLNREISID